MMNDDDLSVQEHPQKAYVPSEPSGNYRLDSSELGLHWGMTFRDLRSMNDDER